VIEKGFTGSGRLIQRLLEDLVEVAPFLRCQSNSIPLKKKFFMGLTQDDVTESQIHENFELLTFIIRPMSGVAANLVPWLIGASFLWLIAFLLWLFPPGSFRLVNPDRCPRCDSRDIRRSMVTSLFDHLRSGSGLRPFRCRRCLSRFLARAPRIPVEELREIETPPASQEPHQSTSLP
jgi:hypothetical protein